MLLKKNVISKRKYTMKFSCIIILNRTNFQKWKFVRKTKTKTKQTRILYKKREIKIDIKCKKIKFLLGILILINITSAVEHNFVYHDKNKKVSKILSKEKARIQINIFHVIENCQNKSKNIMFFW